MKNFEVSRLENSSYDYLVIATTYISPISTLDEVQKAFKNISGKILFNLTLINRKWNSQWKVIFNRERC